MLWSVLFYFCILICINSVKSDVEESRVVNIVQGPVRGYKNKETGIYDFYSIPYATVPTGLHRFKAPLPAPVWSQPLEAKNQGIICPQPPFPQITENKTIQENCLIMNVHVPDTDQQNLPVVVYVHGGGFQIGFGNMLVPAKLIAEHNIIAVTFNYRLGVHGFLSLGTEYVPGNAGMKDQVTALRWVNKNIAAFGGNPDDVTIAGYSAGSAAVDLLMLSKSVDGLFKKVIPESGASIAGWTIQSNPLENAKLFAQNLNFDNIDNIHELENFYLTSSFELLNNYSFVDKKGTAFGFSPCIERIIDEEVFLDISPIDILKSGNYVKYPMLYGFANMEGLLRIQYFDSWKEEMNENFSQFLPSDLQFKSDEEKYSVSNQIKRFYFGNNPVGENNVLEYVNYFTDVFFAYPALRSVKYHIEAGHNNIYLYDFSFVDDNSMVVPHTNIKGANHCAQTFAVFGGMPGYPTNFTKDFEEISSTLINIWSNFIKTGKPVTEGSSLPHWPPVGRGWSPHMSISNELQLKGSLLEERMRFWEQIYENYYYDPIPAPAPSHRHVDL